MTDSFDREVLLSILEIDRNAGVSAATVYSTGPIAEDRSVSIVDVLAALDRLLAEGLIEEVSEEEAARLSSRSGHSPERVYSASHAGYRVWGQEPPD